MSDRADLEVLIRHAAVAGIAHDEPLVTLLADSEEPKEAA